MPSWEHFYHGADIGVRGFGDSKASAFAETALAMTAVICEPDDIIPEQCIAVSVTAPDDELLLVDWLNALVYEMATRKMLFNLFTIDIQDQHLTAKACGETIDVQRHHPSVEVKGATFTELAVSQDESGQWRAQCVVDV